MSLHDRDFYTWTQQQAALLRAGRLAELDVANLLEEVEDMGRSEKRELLNRLAVLLAHLLKWRYQSQRRGRSWALTIKEQRLEARAELEDNPGLKPRLPEAFHRAYARACLQAAKETRLEESSFPKSCPWTVEQVLDDEFWPE